MTKERFVALVRRLDDVAVRSPRAYHVRVALLAAVGYAYVLAVLTAALALAAFAATLLFSGRGGGYGAFKLELLALGLIALILRALWVRIPPPEGLPVTRQSAPALFAMLDDLTRQLRAPQVHQVLIDGDFNAGLVQTPRLGVMGWQRNTLVLGLPLLYALSPEAFRAVIAHELGHLSGNHSRFAGWIYRVEATWERLLQQLEVQNQRLAFLFTGFFRRYSPYFSAYTFALRRQHEYEADRCAAEVTSPAAAASALLSIAVTATLLDEHVWKHVEERNRRGEPPPDDLYDWMGQRLREAPATVSVEQARGRALAEKTGYDDSHPALADRLAALGVAADEARTMPVGPPAEPAAVRYLGPALPVLAQQLSRRWLDGLGTAWDQRQQETRKGEERLAELEERAASQVLTEAEAEEVARLTYELRTDEEAARVASSLVDRFPNSAVVRFVLGRALLSLGNAEGLSHLERAMELDADATVVSCKAAYDFLREMGEQEKAEAYRDRAEEHQDAWHRRQVERYTVREDAAFLPHDVGEEVLEELRRRLWEHRRAGEAYLVRKQRAPDDTGPPVYIIGVVPHAAMFRLESDSADQRLADALQEKLDVGLDHIVLVMGSGTGKLRKRIRSAAGEPFYRRKDYAAASAPA